MVPYCDADNLPDKHDRGADNEKVYYCPHRIDLELNKVYELLLIDDTPDEPDVNHPIHMVRKRYHEYAFVGKTYSNVSFLDLCYSMGMPLKFSIWALKRN